MTRRVQNLAVWKYKACLTAALVVAPSGLFAESFSLQISLAPSNSVQLEFTAQANTGYLIESSDSVGSNAWQVLVVLDPIPSVHPVVFTQPIDATRPATFYRVRSSGGMTSDTAESISGRPALVSAQNSTLVPSSREAGLAVFAPQPELREALPQVQSAPALSAEQAGALARQLANARAHTLYGSQPFRGTAPAQFVNGRWFWRDWRGWGTSDLEVNVSFGVDATAPSVNLRLLNSAN